MKTVLAICAHPDDIEFMMAGTMILLRKAGYELHYMTVANGSCGSNRYDTQTLIRMRRQEAMAAAASPGAVFHESVCNDLEVFYTLPLLAKVAAVVRRVAPEIVLTHVPSDYREDHMNACRLAVTAAFARGMPNFQTDPPQAPVDNRLPSTTPSRTATAIRWGKWCGPRSTSIRATSWIRSWKPCPSTRASGRGWGTVSNGLVLAGPARLVPKSAGCQAGSSSPKAGGGTCTWASAARPTTRWSRRSGTRCWWRRGSRSRGGAGQTQRRGLDSPQVIRGALPSRRSNLHEVRPRSPGRWRPMRRPGKAMPECDFQDAAPILRRDRYLDDHRTSTGTPSLSMTTTGRRLPANPMSASQISPCWDPWPSRMFNISCSTSRPGNTSAQDGIVLPHQKPEEMQYL